MPLPSPATGSPTPNPTPGIPGTAGTPTPSDGGTLPGSPIPTSTPGTVGTSPPPTPGGGGVSLGGGISEGMRDVLRQLIKDQTFRAAFFEDRVSAITGACIHITSADLDRLSKLTSDDLDQFSQAIGALGGGAAGLKSEGGTHTLLYAVVIALLLA
jgi:hypothetical protein